MGGKPKQIVWRKPKQTTLAARVHDFVQSHVCLQRFLAWLCVCCFVIGSALVIIWLTCDILSSKSKINQSASQAPPDPSVQSTPVDPPARKRRRPSRSAKGLPAINQLTGLAQYAAHRPCKWHDRYDH